MNYYKAKAVWWSGSCYHKEQLDAILNHLDIKHRAHILHDKCPKEDGSGEFKKPHYHFLVQFNQQVRGSWFKMFSSDDMGIVFIEPAYAPKGAFDYLIHNTAASIKAGKHLYDEAERITDIEGFDEEVKEIDENQLLLDDIHLVKKKEMTWDEFYSKKPKRIHMSSNIANTFERLNRGKFDKVFRQLTVSYIYGTTAKGKTRHVMEKYGYENVFRVTKYDRSAFDGYAGQDVIVFEEFRSSFKIEEMLNYLDGYPLLLPSRYIDKEAGYTKVYIITNWRLDEQYKNVQTEYPSTWDAFNRRIHAVYDFGRNKELNLKEKPEQINYDQHGMRILSDAEVMDLPF